MRSLLNPGGIGFRFLAFLLLGGLWPTALLGFLVFQFIEHELQQQLGRELMIQVESIRNQIDRELMASYLELRRLSVQEFLPDQPEVALRAFVRRAAEDYGGGDKYRCVAVVEDGKPTFRVGDCTHLQAFRAPPGETPLVSEPYMVTHTEPVIDFWFAREETDSGLLVSYSLSFLSELLSRTDVPGGVYLDLLVLSADGKMLARKDAGRGLVMNAPALYPMLYEPRDKAGGHALGWVTGGGEAVAASRNLVGLLPELAPVSGWQVAVVQPLTDGSERTVVLINRMRFGLLLAVVATLTCSLLFAVILLRGILSPVRALTQATMKLRAGDLVTPVKVKGVTELSQLGEVFDEMREQLRDLLEQLTELASTDELTGLPNRREVNRRLREEARRARRYGQSLSIAILDLDHFKRVNDTFGHPFGDRVLRDVAELGRRLCRDTDLMGRFGGEEFIFILPLTSRSNAVLIMERIREAISSTEVCDPVAGYRVRMTASIGIANIPKDADDEESLLIRADEALYLAKSGGRNRVVSNTAA
jgi:diguanylate cyclase (GGDEF)-like protein